MDPSKRYNPSIATGIGLAALFIWALSPSIITELGNIPTFQLSTTVFSFALLLTIGFLFKNKNWQRAKQHPKVWILGFLAIFVNQAAYVFALRLIPVEQAEVIYYLWPIALLLISACFFENGLPLTSVISAILGLVGVYILFTDGQGIGEVYLDSGIGYGCALLAGGAWVLYCLLNRYNEHIPLEMNGMWCGLAAIACLFITWQYEELLLPSFYEWSLMAFIGIFTLTFSLWMWSHAIRHGHFTFLTVMSYMTPLTSVLLLMLFGKVDFSYSILIACQLIVLGGALCSIVEWMKLESE